MIRLKVATCSEPLLLVVDSFNPDSMGSNLAPSAVARLNKPGKGDGEPNGNI